MPRVHNLLDGFLASAEQMSREGYRRTLDAAQHSDDDLAR
jgi:hypothetical protein